jgi:hypothetical protein
MLPYSVTTVVLLAFINKQFVTLHRAFIFVSLATLISSNFVASNVGVKNWYGCEGK